MMQFYKNWHLYMTYSCLGSLYAMTAKDRNIMKSIKCISMKMRTQIPIR